MATNGAGRGASVSLDGLEKSYDGTAAVAGVSLDIHSGEFLTLLGPSGSGKTTTLNLIAGFLTPDRGEIFIANLQNDVRAAFADYTVIFSLGIGAIMNVPVRFRGRSLGTMNICSEAGWFSKADRAPGRLLASLLVPPLLA